ncbi:Beta-glucanase [Dactylella cylindrospora]|nr:Beta-glucanase [Dactylella cylindrospora]
MHVKSIILLSATLLPTAFAQTNSLCNPLKGCFKDDPALGGTYTYDFTQSHSAAPQFDIVSSASRISYQGDGMHMRVQMTGDSPTLQSQFYIFWGKLDVVMKAGPGAGIVSSLVFQSDVLDEIDVEFIGSQPGNVQTNIFSKGNQDVHIYGDNHAVDDATGKFHTYTVDWTPEAITWLIDGNVVRVLTRASLGDVYPQTPMQIKFGPWAAGDASNAPGTIEWAGGVIDYSQGPFDMVVQSLTITDYSKGATKYRYKDGSGSSESIEITYGGVVEPDPTTSSTPPPAPTTTSKSTPPPAPTTTSTPPPPPTTSTSTSTTEEPETSTESTSSTSSSSSSSSSSTSSTSYKPSTTSTSKEPTSTSQTHGSTFTVESTSTSEPTERADPTTLQTSVASVTEPALAATSTTPANSGAGSVRAGWSLVIALGALFVLF